MMQNQDRIDRMNRIYPVIMLVTSFITQLKIFPGKSGEGRGDFEQVKLGVYKSILVYILVTVT